MSDITLFRLHSGEEVIAKVLDNSNNTWTIKSPAILLPMGEGRLGMGAWLPYCNTDSMQLPEKAVAFTVSPKKELVNNYNSGFGSGIVVPENDLDAPASLKLITE